MLSFCYDFFSSLSLSYSMNPVTNFLLFAATSYSVTCCYSHSLQCFNSLRPYFILICFPFVMIYFLPYLCSPSYSMNPITNFLLFTATIAIFTATRADILTLYNALTGFGLASYYYAFFLLWFFLFILLEVSSLSLLLSYRYFKNCQTLIAHESNSSSAILLPKLLYICDL